MAIFRLEIKALSRGKGRNAVEAAAYISRDKLRDEQHQRTYNFRHRGGLEYAEILVPQRANQPAQTPVPQRSDPWNQAERAERRRDARVAREYQISLPNELAPPDRIALARRFAQDIANLYGGAVDMAVHRAPPGGDPRNVHAHILSTTREYHPEGLGKKTRIELSGYQRKPLGLPPRRAEYTQVRARWAEIANEALREHGIDARIDHRTLAEQGIIGRAPNHVSRAAIAVMRRRDRDRTAEQLPTEQAAIRAREHAVGNDPPAPSLETRRQRALESWKHYRQQERASQPEVHKERDGEDRRPEPGRLSEWERDR